MEEEEVLDEPTVGGGEGRPRKASIKEGKVIVKLMPTGNAPILKQSKFKVSASDSFQFIIDFLRKQLKFKPTDSLFLFCNSSFAPCPDACIADLAHCFSIDGCLVVNYCPTEAWG
eukprot:c15853_g1_i3.p1 GENE.c15853_g1_i3~~c15853_g1_i3.p1  ORF type:complete len:115 (+),score=13.84 c15853_g1_i3:37-381(+)